MVVCYFTYVILNIYNKEETMAKGKNKERVCPENWVYFGMSLKWGYGEGLELEESLDVDGGKWALWGQAWYWNDACNDYC